MKTQKKHGQSLYLQQRSKRWKWMAGATAATAAGVSASQAGTITINLLNNDISGSGGNHLNADLTGDGQPDITTANAKYQLIYRNRSSTSLHSYIFYAVASVHLNGILARASFNSYPGAELIIGSHGYGGEAQYVPTAFDGSIPIFCKDLHINGGELTEGSLEVTVAIPPLAGGRDAWVILDSFTYNAVADQGSSLALLAIGAGGVLALRRRKIAQGPSQNL
jgi:MYXO-CTERM domain-containing protein